MAEAKTLYGPRETKELHSSPLLHIESLKQEITLKNGEIVQKDVIVVSVFREKWSSDLRQMVSAKSFVEMEKSEFDELKKYILANRG